MNRTLEKNTEAQRSSGGQFSVPLIAGVYKSPLRYPGGKQKAADQIFKMFPSNALEYREPLVGGGSVFFHAKTIDFAKKYWINDKFQELISFWQTVQNPVKCIRLMKELEKLRSGFSSVEEIKDYFLRSRDQIAHSEYREAFLFFFFNRVSFSGTTKAGGFSGEASLSRFTQSSIERLASMPEALADVLITNLDFAKLITKPGKDVFLFLDPPYYTATKLYGRKGNLHEFDHEKLASLLKKTSHRFLITYDDCKEIRNLYNKWAKVKSWQLQYGMNNCNHQRESKIGTELFIYNY